MDNNDQQLLNEREVAAWLGISAPTLVRHRRDGTGPTFIRLSLRRIAYRRSTIEEWLRERECDTVRAVGHLNALSLSHNINSSKHDEKHKRQRGP